MILIDNKVIAENIAIADKSFVCCFCKGDAYKCIVHTAQNKNLFELIVAVEKEAIVRELTEYDIWFHGLDTLCKSKSPNSEEVRLLINNLIPVEWNMVKSSLFCNETLVSQVRDFLLSKLGGKSCEIKLVSDSLGVIDGNSEN